MINSKEFNGTEIVKAIKKKLLGKSPISQRLSLDLLETCTSNCEKVFSKVASEKVLDDMLKVIDDPKTDHKNLLKAMQMIRAWGESEDLVYLPVFQQTYENELTESMLENCKQSLPDVQRIIEGLLIKAFSLHDELQKVISRYEQSDGATESGGSLPEIGVGRCDEFEKKEANFLGQDENEIDAESKELSKVETTEPNSEFLKTVALEKDGTGTAAAAKERVNSD